ncbi:MAG: hypothetical protein MJZ58_01940 [Paludibacteraceae bacterium]|nr:hypothetical protein [Paludibacteraceae bacterium]
MKTQLWLSLVVLAVLATACKPKNYMNSLEELVPNTDSTLVLKMHPRCEIDAKDPNLVHFRMDDVEGWVGMWEIGGRRYTTNSWDSRFQFAGDYAVRVSAYNHHGPTPGITLHFYIEVTDESVCANDDYRYLTGGCDAPEGKTWMLANQTGYYGLIDINTWAIEYLSDYWWAAERGSHQGVYDDELTFFLNANCTYQHKTNGTSGIDSNPFDCPDYATTWELIPAEQNADGFPHLFLSGDGFLPPIPSECQGQHEYVVLTLNDTVLLTKIFKSGSNQAWVHKFVPKND